MLLQWWYPCCCIYLFILIFKSVYGILKFFSVTIKTDLAALSTCSFPLIPVWLGIQHSNISLSFDIFSNLHKSFISGSSSFLLCNEVNTDKSERIMKLWFLNQIQHHIYYTRFCIEYEGIIWEIFLIFFFIVYCSGFQTPSLVCSSNLDGLMCFEFFGCCQLLIVFVVSSIFGFSFFLKLISIIWYICE